MVIGDQSCVHDLPNEGPVLVEDVAPRFNAQRNCAVSSSVHVGQRTPCSKLQSQGDCGAIVVRRVVVVLRAAGRVVPTVGTASYNGRIEQLLVVNVKSSIEISP